MRPRQILKIKESFRWLWHDSFMQEELVGLLAENCKKTNDRTPSSAAMESTLDLRYVIRKVTTRTNKLTRRWMSKSFHIEGLLIVGFRGVDNFPWCQ